MEATVFITVLESVYFIRQNFGFASTSRTVRQCLVSELRYRKAEMGKFVLENFRFTKDNASHRAATVGLLES